MNVMKYCEYFDINETYFPCIDESAINAGVDWQTHILMKRSSNFSRVLKTCWAERRSAPFGYMVPTEREKVSALMP